MPTQILSTDAVAAHERFDFWREVLCRTFYGMTPERPEPPSERPFDATLRATPLADAMLVDLDASAHLCVRDEPDIEAAPGNAIYVYLQKRGAAWFDTPDDRQPFLTPFGTMAIGFSDRPMRTAPTPHHRFDFRLLRIPLSHVTPLIGQRAVLRASVLDMHAGATRLLHAWLHMLFQDREAFDAPAAELAVQTAAHLAAAAYGLSELQHELTRDAIRAGKRQYVRTYIERNLDRPDLSPAVAAGELGISVRQLHLLFEPTGVSFARQVRAQRAARARWMLTQRADMKVIEIAFACGFDSLRTFYRAFRDAYGMPPSELRESMKRAAP